MLLKNNVIRYNLGNLGFGHRKVVERHSEHVSENKLVNHLAGYDLDFR